MMHIKKVNDTEGCSEVSVGNESRQVPSVMFETPVSERESASVRSGSASLKPKRGERLKVKAL